MLNQERSPLDKKIDAILQLFKQIKDSLDQLEKIERTNSDFWNDTEEEIKQSEEQVAEIKKQVADKLGGLVG